MVLNIFKCYTFLKINYFVHIIFVLKGFVYFKTDSVFKRCVSIQDRAQRIFLTKCFKFVVYKHICFQQNRKSCCVTLYVTLFCISGVSIKVVFVCRTECKGYF